MIRAQPIYPIKTRRGPWSSKRVESGACSYGGDLERRRRTFVMDAGIDAERGQGRPQVKRQTTRGVR